MNKIIIDPHSCSQIELEELKAYLEKNQWDWKEITGCEQDVELDNGNRTIEVLGHIVEYWFVNDADYVDGICLSDSDEEHIEHLIAEGYVEGELCSCLKNETVGEPGWWKIKR